MENNKKIYGTAMHPYTRALLSAVPVAKPGRKKERILLEGDIPSPINPPRGCRFHTRCWKKIDLCDREEPPLIEVLPSHFCACHRTRSMTA